MSDVGIVHAIGPEQGFTASLPPLAVPRMCPLNLFVPGKLPMQVGPLFNNLTECGRSLEAIHIPAVKQLPPPC